MTTKGGLENNIPKDVAMQYKVYVAARQYFFEIFLTLLTAGFLDYIPYMNQVDKRKSRGWKPR